MKIKKTYKEFIKESNEYIDEKTINDIFIDLIDMDFTLTFIDGYRASNDYQMVSGIIDILKKVKDKENRMEIAKDMISQFKREDIKFDYDKFLDSIK